MFFSKRVPKILLALMGFFGTAFVGILVFPFFQKVLEDAQAYGRPNTRFSYLQDVLLDILGNSTVAWLSGISAGSFIALSITRWLISHEMIHRRALRVSVQTPQEVYQAFDAAPVCITPRMQMSDLQEELDCAFSPLSEAYYSLRASILQTSRGRLPRSILVTSSQMAEGKSTTAFALARQFSEVGYRVCLVDADFRRPTLRTGQDESRPYGLNGVAMGYVSIEEATYRWRTSLDVIPAGGRQDNAADLLTLLWQRGFWRDLSDRYDLLVVDSPPVLGLADAPILGMSLEHIVFVMEANQTLLETAGNAHRRIRESVANTTIVLSKAGRKNLRGTSFISNYGYGYGYGYGYEPVEAAREIRAQPPEPPRPPAPIIPTIPLDQLTPRRIALEIFRLAIDFKWLLIAITALAMMVGVIAALLSNDTKFGKIAALTLLILAHGFLILLTVIGIKRRSKNAMEDSG